jgi:hypothetical protein
MVGTVGMYDWKGNINDLDTTVYCLRFFASIHTKFYDKDYRNMKGTIKFIIIFLFLFSDIF